MRKTVVSLAAVMAVVGAMLLGAMPASAGDQVPIDKVTLCHATNSATNPYVRITVDIAAAGADVGQPKGGHANHDEPDTPLSVAAAQALKAAGTKWGDVVPSYFYEKKDGSIDFFPGVNWDADGMQLFRQDCAVEGTEEEFARYRLVRRMPFGNTDVFKLQAGLVPDISCDTSVDPNLYVVKFNDGTEKTLEVGESRKGSILRVRSDGVVLAKVRAVDIC